MAHRDYDHSRSESSRYDRGNRGGYDRGYGDERRGGERDWFNRAGDEVRSWFGDEDADRRRHMDERRDDMSEMRRGRYDYDNGSDYRHNYGSHEYDSDRVQRDLDRDRRENDYSRRSQGGDNWRENMGGSWNNDNQWRGGNQGMSGSRDRNEGRRDWSNGSNGNWSGGSGSNAGWNTNSNMGSSGGSQGWNTHESWGGRDNDRFGNNPDMYNVGYNRDHDSYRQPERHQEYGADRSGRDWTDRAGDEVRSWFGDDRAEQRRRMDDRRDDRYDNDRRDSRMW